MLGRHGKAAHHQVVARNGGKASDRKQVHRHKQQHIAHGRFHGLRVVDQMHVHSFFQVLGRSNARSFLALAGR